MVHRPGASGTLESMHTLVILRHAKAEYREDIADIERPLTRRGKSDAAAAGAWLANSGYRPDLVLCSPAKRTRQTWHEVALAMAEAAQDSQTLVKYDRAIYDGGFAELMGIVRTAGEASTVLLIGHNPAVSALSGRLDPDAERDTDGLKTSGIAVHADEAEWSAWAVAPLTAAHTARGTGA